jgi:hypothetical protein
MRLIWLPIIALACVGTVFLFRSSLGAHAENYSDAIEKVQSNKEAKGIDWISSIGRRRHHRRLPFNPFWLHRSLLLFKLFRLDRRQQSPSRQSPRTPSVGTGVKAQKQSPRLRPAERKRSFRVPRFAK